MADTRQIIQGERMNQSEFKQIMHEIEQIIQQLAQCHGGEKGLDLASQKMLSDLFRMKLAQACQLKKAS